MTEKKITKRDNFNTIIEVLTSAGREDLAAVIAHEIELLDNKAAKAKATAAKKKVEGEDITTAKVQFRLNALVNAGIASKEQVTVGEGDSKRKLMAYKLNSETVSEN